MFMLVPEEVVKFVSDTRCIAYFLLFPERALLYVPAEIGTGSRRPPRYASYIEGISRHF